MTIARVPIAQQIESRSASLSKDSLSKNCYFETRNGNREIIKRPGLVEFAVAPALTTTAQGMFAFSDGNLYVAANNTLSKITTAGVSSTIGTLVGTLNVCYFNQTATTPYLLVHNTTNLYTVTTAGTFAEATQLDTILDGISLTAAGRIVPGVVYLDGYTIVMTSTGRLYNSDIEAPLTWNALNYITAEAEPDLGMGIAKHFNYVVAFGQWSTEFFYDAANATGSPLARNAAARIEIGCSNGESITEIEQSVIWIGQSKTQGKSVYMLNGLSPVKISTPWIEKYLNADQEDRFRGYAFKISGHTFYVMTQYETYPNAHTFVYDIDEKEWYVWSSIISANETYFRPSYYVQFNGNYYGMNVEDSLIYTVSTTAYDDDGEDIQFGATTAIMDSGTTKYKFYRKLEVIGDKVAGTMQVRHTDDDYQTWSNYRNVDLSLVRPQLYQLGAARRRAWQFLCTDAVPLRLAAAEIDFDIGHMEGANG